MIPRLPSPEPVDSLHADFLRALPAAGFSGEVRADAAARLSVATDNSVYQRLPQAVVFPRGEADVVALLSLLGEPRFHGVSVTPRGGGTGTNGQALTGGVVADLSRHMDRIGPPDLAAGTVRVEPGVVLDALNASLEPHGVFFAPTLSPSNRATLGGMIATDASGKGSRVYGRTSDHLVSLSVVLAGGGRIEAGPVGAAALREATGPLAVLRDVLERNARAIEERFPKLRRFLTGYDLARLRDDEGRLHLERLFAGAEGTLGIVTSATLRLTPIPKHRSLVVLRFGTFDEALACATELLPTEPAAVETIDETVLGLARNDVIWHRVGPLLEREGEAPPAAIHLVEYAGDDEADVRARAEVLLRDRPGAVLARDAAEAKALWELRKKGVGLLGAAPGARKPVPFVEDTVVPPEHLAAYVRDFRAILEAEGLRYGMFGHVDVGCLHVRPALDLTDPEDERRLRRVSDRVEALARSYGGLLWGEHGKGYRSEYNPEVFGEELFRALCEIKQAFDPWNQLNPGKIAVPAGSGARLASVDDVKRGAFDREIPAALRGLYHEALDCNGNGACFDWHPDHVMCPSSKVTRDRVHSPKGRAGVLREWLRLLARAGVPTEALDAARIRRRRGPVPFLRRVGASLGRAFGRYDYSHEVAGAMAGCLACKACATHCPVKVDVPAFRSSFLHLYHSRYLRPLRDPLIAGLESALPRLARAPRLVNALQSLPPVRWFLAGVLGLVDTPALAVPTARELLRARGLAEADPAAIAAAAGAVPDAERARHVVLVQDAFTTFYEPRVLAAAVDLLRALGREVHVLRYAPSGKGLHVRGYLDRFLDVAAREAARLREVAALGVPLVGLEPATVLLYRDEVPKLLGAAGADLRVQLLQEHLATLAPEAPPARPASEPLRLLAHCTERTAEVASQDRWRAVFRSFGLSLETVDAGCCGMCGAYGHEAVHRAESEGIFRMSWARHLDPPGRVLATGHSCRTQVERFAGFLPRHPVEALLDAVRAPSAPGG